MNLRIIGTNKNQAEHKINNKNQLHSYSLKQRETMIAGNIPHIVSIKIIRQL